MFRKLKSKLENSKVKPAEVIPKNLQENVTPDNLSKPLETEQIQNETVEKPTNMSAEVSKNKIDELIKVIKTSEEKLISPTLDLMTGKYVFPLLKKLGEKEDNVEFLENLTSESIDILERIVYERIAVCPEHPTSLQANVRLYCPKCNSMNIEKMHLLEHKICGCISERRNFGGEDDESIMKCPSCKKIIKNSKTELRIPAMWYTCIECKEKFDDIKMRMHCRLYNHDIETNMLRTVSIPGYKLKNLKLRTDSHSSIILDLRQIFSEYGFTSEDDCSARGKSKHFHNVDLVGKDSNNNTIFTYISKPKQEIDESEINAKIIPILDCSPTKTIIIGTFSEKAKSIAYQYKIELIESEDKDTIISYFKEILNQGFKKQTTQYSQDENLDDSKIQSLKSKTSTSKTEGV